MISNRVLSCALQQFCHLQPSRLVVVDIMVTFSADASAFRSVAALDMRATPAASTTPLAGVAVPSASPPPPLLATSLPRADASLLPVVSSAQPPPPPLPPPSSRGASSRLSMSLGQLSHGE